MEHKIKHRNRKDGFYQGKKQDRGRKKVMDRSFGVCNYYQIRFKTFTCEERAINWDPRANYKPTP